MLKRAEALCAEYGMLPPGALVLCAVSGGADSMCLLHWLTGQEGVAVHAAHFDHHLRGEESQRDARFVRDWCDSHGVPFHLGGGDVAAEAKRRKQGVEETARQLRYAFLHETADRVGVSFLATAHTANDNAETVLMNLLRGSALQGLTGISPRQGRVIRPLLTTSREEVEGYLMEHHIPHVEDSTNQMDDFLRNKVRHQLVPLLEEWNPGFVERVVDMTDDLRQDNLCLYACAWPVAQRAERRGEELALPAAVLADCPTAVAVRVVRQLLEQAGAGAEGGLTPSSDCTRRHLLAVLALARSKDPSGEVHLPRGLIVRREYDRLVFTPGGRPGPLEPFAPAEGENPVPGTGWTLTLRCPPWPGLVIRPRQTGDRLTLPGRPGKSLKELFIDEKLPRWDRASVPVAADGQGVVAVAGFGPNTEHPRWKDLEFTEK